MKRRRLIVLIFIIIAGLVFFGIYWVKKNKSADANASANANTPAAAGVLPDTAEKDSIRIGATAAEVLASAKSNFFNTNWLEVPASPVVDDVSIHYITHWGEMGGKQQRNYSYCYDSDTYTSSWVAYPLCAAHLSTGREEYWSFDTAIPAELQTNVSSGYGASEATANYPKNFYARGHQIPNADRNGVPEMMAQTYFSTNMTPQLQNGFNGGIWAKLEGAVREAVPANDTLYIVTGAFFGESSEKLKTIVNKNDKNELPVPNFYWKAVLKVIRDDSGQPASAATIGFWLPHTDLKGHSFTEYAVSVDSIEALTGLDLFTNLPDSLEAIVETATSWPDFLAF